MTTNNHPAAEGSEYITAAMQYETDALARTAEGSRNDQLNTAAFNLGQLVNPTGTTEKLTPAAVESALLEACRDNGLLRDDGIAQCRKTIKSGMAAGMKDPRDLSDIGDAVAANVTETRLRGDDDEDDQRRLVMRNLDTVKVVAPKWVWEHDEKGRIQLGTLNLFAGKPGVGKSTAARYFIARLTRGELAGDWYGEPCRVAVISTEESEEIITAGLRAAGADSSMIDLPEIHQGENIFAPMALADELELTRQLIDNGCRALFVDPLTDALTGAMDINRVNEVRAQLAPYQRIAKAIQGIVVGVTHFRKGATTDVMDAINGSGAFGQVARGVFGMAANRDEPGQFIFEQVKNSAGPTGLRLAYHLPVVALEDDDGTPFEVTRFEITGTAPMSITDLAHDGSDIGSAVQLSNAVEWLHDYLLREQPAPSKQVRTDAERYGDISKNTLYRAADMLGVKRANRPQPGKPNVSVWRLPSEAGD